MEIDTFDDNFTFSTAQEWSRRPRLDSRMSVCLPSKGLFNAPGENNCFLNASVQVLWHLNVFRRSFRLLEGHACLEDACIFCALKRIFQQFQDSDAAVLAPDGLRQAMANAFSDDQRFQLGRMDDAAECFENILNRLHSHTAIDEPDDACAAKHCIPHQKFALHILEQTFCKCQASGEPKSFYQFVYYVAASVIVDQMKNDDGDSLTFGQVLKSTVSGESRPCPDERRCYYKNAPDSMTTVQTTLLNCPDVVTVGIIWNTDSPSARYITDVLDCIGQSLYLIDLFDNIPDNEYRRLELKLAGVVSYYGRHYTSFFYNAREEQWVYFDDARVKKIGSKWEHVVSKCRRNRFQPLLVVYTNSSGVPIDAANAPSLVEIVSKEKLLYKPQKSPTQRKQKHRKHKKNRSRTSSPSLSPTDGVERSLSRSSGASMSPRSPKKHKTKREGQRPVEVTDDTSDFDNHLSSKMTRTGIHGSLSDNSIVDSTRNGQPFEYSKTGSSLENSFDEMDNLTKKRSGSIKKKFSNAMKNINPLSKKPIVKNVNATLSDSYDKISHSNSLNDICYADIGFNSPHQTRNEPQSSGNAPTKQLENLSIHQAMLNRSRDDLTKTDNNSINIEKNYNHVEENRDKHNGYHVNDVNGRPAQSAEQVIGNYQRTDANDFMQNERDNSNGANASVRDDDLIHFNSRPRVVTVTQPPSYENHLEGEFEKLLHTGERLMHDSYAYEREGDILLAMHTCSEATAAYREASRLPGISDSLLHFVDDQRSNSYLRSRLLQEKADKVMKGGVTPTDINMHSSTIPSSQHEDVSGSVQSRKTKYESGLGNVPTYDSKNSPHMSWYENKHGSVTSAARQSPPNLIEFSPEKKSFDSQQQDTKNLPHYSQPPNYRELEEMKSVISSFNSATPHVNDSRNVENLGTSFPRPTVKWVTDKPNNSSQSKINKITQLRNSQSMKQPVRQPISNAQTLRQPKSSGHDLREFIQRDPRLYNPSYMQTLPNKMSSARSKLKNERARSIYDNVESDTNICYDNRLNNNERELRVTDVSKNNVSMKKTIYDDNVSIPAWFERGTEQTRTRNLIDRLNDEEILNSVIEKPVSDTLQKIKTQGKRTRCIQCGWRFVEVEGKCCTACQSEFL